MTLAWPPESFLDGPEAIDCLQALISVEHVTYGKESLPSLYGISFKSIVGESTFARLRVLEKGAFLAVKFAEYTDW